MPASLTPLEEDILATLERQRRTAAPVASTDAVREQLRAWRIPATTLSFETVISVPGEARFTLARRDAPVPAIVHPYSAATAPSGLVAELRPDTAATLVGAIALAEGDPDSASIARLATRGAVGVVYISQDETLRSVPVANAWGAAAPIPVIAIGREAGEGFLALCSAGPTAVRLTVEVSWQPHTAAVTTATIAGADEPGDFLLVGATLPADASNADTAAANLLALCHALAPHAGRLRRGIRCVWWPGEVAPNAGAIWYGDHFWEELGGHCWGYVVLCDAASDPALSGWSDPHLRHFAEATLRDGDVSRPRWSAEPPVDLAPFARLGLPTLALNTRPDTLATTLPLFARLCTTPLPPLDLVALARTLQERIGATIDAVGDALDLAPLRARAAALYAAAERFQIALLHLAQGASPNDEEGFALANRLLRHLQRALLPALQHPGDPYATPPPVAAPLPGLAPTPAYLDISTPRTAPEAVILRAAALRERNRLLDTLNAATAVIDDALTTLRPLGFG